MQKISLLSTIQFLVRILTKFRVLNKDYIPTKGGVLITTNHLSRLDTPLLMTITDRKDLVAIVAKSYRQKPFFKWILERVGTVVWMDRDTTDFSAMRQALNELRKGAIVGIAPEGTRSTESKGLLPGKQGAVLMASRVPVPIVPVGIIGSEKINETLLKLRRPPVTINVGEPYYLPPIDMENRQAWLKTYTDEMMCRIAVLLPEEYRGFYADHPRLKELLAGNFTMPR